MRSEIYCEYAEEQRQSQFPTALTAAEAMDILGVGKNTMYRMLNSGMLRGVRVGRSWRIASSVLEDYLLAK